jgi:hypothetical protein
VELKELDRIADPKERQLQRQQMIMQKQSLLNTSLANLANMRQDMLRAVAQNMRA